MPVNEFAKKCFKRYYAMAAAGISVPALNQREFGFGSESKIDYRHKAFASERDFHEFLSAEAPLYASYSAARYSLPSGRPMPRKGLLGCDLVFDLDKTYEFEHPEAHNPIACCLCLGRGRDDALRFYEEFLLADFGFSKGEVKINFSGSKGFHFHVRSDAVQQLGGLARKTLCDYAGAFEVNGAALFTEAGAGKGASAQLRGPSSSSHGWPGKAFGHVKAFLESADEKQLHEKGLSRPKASKLFAEKPSVLAAIAKGNWDYLPGLKDFWSALADEAIARHRVELDKPVSFDLGRLIRVPGTLHGTTGFIAKEIAAGGLPTFEPLRDALAFKLAEVQEIVCFEDVSLELGGQSLDFKKDKLQSAPLSAALLLSLKGAAGIPLQ